MARRAVVFGSNGPRNAGSLRYAAKDVARVADIFRHPRCSFEVVELPNTDDPSVIEKCVRQIAQLSREGDTLAIFFTGHGFIEGSNLWLMLDSTEVDKPMTTALDAETIVKALRLSPATHKILILDCCHAGMAFSDSRFKDNPEAPVRQFVAPPEEESSSFVALVASDRLQKAREIDSLQSSFFSNALCDALGDSFEEADEDQDGAIDLADLKKWLTDAARRYNEANPSATVPVPFAFGRERGRLFLTRDPSDWPIVEVESSGHEFVLLPFLGSRESAWLIGKTPVTNVQYKTFVEETGHSEPVGLNFVRGQKRSQWKGPFHPWRDDNFSNPDQPVVCVDFNDARAFARWMESRIKNVPAENTARPFKGFLKLDIVPTDVWEFAAFGSYRPLFDRRTWLRGNIHHKSSAPAIVTNAHARSNRFGVVDLFGNVWEWTDIGGKPSFERPSRTNLDYDPFGNERAWVKRNQQLRGGGFLDDLTLIQPQVTASQLKDRLRTKHTDLGFRIAVEILVDFLPEEIRSRLQSAPRMVEVSREHRIIKHGHS